MERIRLTVLNRIINSLQILVVTHGCAAALGWLFTYRQFSLGFIGKFSY